MFFYAKKQKSLEKVAGLPKKSLEKVVFNIKTIRKIVRK